MNINNLSDLLLIQHNLEGKFIEDKGRIYLNLSKQYITYLQSKSDGGYSIKIFLAKKKFGENYKTSEWRECFLYRDEVIEKLNDLHLGITFNSKGETGND